MAGYRRKAPRKSAAQPVTRSAGARGGKNCSEHEALDEKSEQEDAVMRVSFPGPRSDFEREGFSYRFVPEFSKSTGGNV